MCYKDVVIITIRIKAVGETPTCMKARMTQLLAQELDLSRGSEAHDSSLDSRRVFWLRSRFVPDDPHVVEEAVDDSGKHGRRIQPQTIPVSLSPAVKVGTSRFVDLGLELRGSQSWEQQDGVSFRRIIWQEVLVSLVSED